MELQTQNNAFGIKARRFYLPITILLVGLVIGFFVGQYKPIEPISRLINNQEVTYKDVNFELFWQVWDKLNEKYVEHSALDPEKLLYGAISGMVSSAGDPYTAYFEPQENKKFQEEISGSFGGVGIEIAVKDEILTVIAPLKGTPAERGGIVANDKILKIDNKETLDLSADEAVAMIRGKIGSTVTLNILSINGEVRDIALIRASIKIPTVDLTYIEQEGKKIAYLRIYSFNQIVDGEFKKAAQEILDNKADKVILDLRNNPGGLLNSAINIAGWFLNKDQIVVMEDYGNGDSDVYRANGNASLKMPIVVLINAGSASASEILAGALHDNRGIKLVGEKTFGKGSVQELENFSDGSALKVTVAKWLTPNGLSISKKGIEADIIVALPIDAEALKKIEIGTQGKDPQLDRALELLK